MLWRSCAANGRPFRRRNMGIYRCN